MDKKKSYLKFNQQFDYNGVIFFAGKIYEIVDWPNGFVGRWIKRGCKEVENPQSFERDPRFEYKEEVVEEKKVESFEKEEDSPKEDVDENPRPRRGRPKAVDKSADKTENKL